MWKNTRNVFCKTRSARNTGLKGNIDRSNSALAATDKNYRSLQLSAGSNDISIIFRVPRKRLPKTSLEWWGILRLSRRLLWVRILYGT